MFMMMWSDLFLCWVIGGTVSQGIQGGDKIPLMHGTTRISKVLRLLLTCSYDDRQNRAWVANTNLSICRLFSTDCVPVLGLRLTIVTCLPWLQLSTIEHARVRFRSGLTHAHQPFAPFRWSCACEMREILRMSIRRDDRDGISLFTHPMSQCILQPLAKSKCDWY